MSIASEDKIIDALAIRDTSNHNSSASEERGFIPKTVVVWNHLNQTLTCQVQGDIEDGFSNPIDVGDPFDITANTDDYETLTDYFPFMRVVTSCAIAPTSGDLTIYIAKVA